MCDDAASTCTDAALNQHSAPTGWDTLDGQGFPRHLERSADGTNTKIMRDYRAVEL